MGCTGDEYTPGGRADGIIPKIFGDIFKRTAEASKRGMDVTVRLSYNELYEVSLVK